MYAQCLQTNLPVYHAHATSLILLSHCVCVCVCVLTGGWVASPGLRGLISRAHIPHGLRGFDSYLLAPGGMSHV